MSFLSNVYIIKTLSTAKALTLQESQVYRDISEMDIYSDTYFTACFGEGAYACMDELQDTEALADAVARFYELVNAYADANLCELHNNVITIKRGYLKQYFDNKIVGLKNIIDKAAGKDYLKVKYQLKDYLESIDEHIYIRRKTARDILFSRWILGWKIIWKLIRILIYRLSVSSQ